MKHVYHRIAIALVGLVIALGLTGTASAALKDGSFEIGPYANYTMWDSTVFPGGFGLDDEIGYGLWAGWHIRNGHEIEFNYQFSSPDLDPAVAGADVATWMFGYVYNFKNMEKLMPFVRAGIGSTNTQVDAANFDEDDTTYQVGGGARWFFNDKFNLRFGADWQQIDADVTVDNIVVNVGVSWFLGGK